MKPIKQAFALLFVLVLTGCATTDPNRLNAFHDAQPASILVVPPVNKTTDVQAETSVLATLPYYLGEKGFYVFPVNTVKTLLELEGYYEAAEVHAAPPEQLAGLFHADSVLYVTIHEWTSKYILLATTTEVDFEYKLMASDGTLLWQERRLAQYSPNSSNSGSLAGLVANAIDAAIERASPNYIPLTKQVHGQVFMTPTGQSTNQGIPLGPYHPGYDAYYQKVNAQQAAAEKTEPAGAASE